MTEHDPARSGPPEPAPGDLPPPHVPPAPRRKALITVSVLAVLFFLTTTAFGAMWAIEQSDHKGTDSELRTVRDNLGRTTTELEKSRSLYSESIADKARVENNLRRVQECVDATNAYLSATNKEDADRHDISMRTKC